MFRIPHNSDVAYPSLSSSLQARPIIHAQGLPSPDQLLFMSYGKGFDSDDTAARAQCSCPDMCQSASAAMFDHTDDSVILTQCRR